MKVRVTQIIVPAGEESMAAIYKMGMEEGLKAAKAVKPNFIQRHPTIGTATLAVTTGIVTAVGGYCIIHYVIPHIEMKVQQKKEQKRYVNS